jgi:hypothetical protein
MLPTFVYDWSQWQSFTDRINSIDIDISHKVQSVELAPSQEHGSFFDEALQKWRELDCTAHFQSFFSDVHTFVRSLPLILLNKEAVIDIILDHLQVPQTMSIPSLLEYVFSCACELNQSSKCFERCEIGRSERLNRAPLGSSFLVKHASHTCHQSRSLICLHPESFSFSPTAY